MKKILLMAGLMLCLFFAACSKKGDATPTSHTIKFSATGSAGFTGVVSVLKTTSTVSTALDTKTVTVGQSYDYTTNLSVGDVVNFEMQTSGENLLSYSITDNGTVVVQQSGKEVSSFSKISAEYTVK